MAYRGAQGRGEYSFGITCEFMESEFSPEARTQ